MRCFRACLAGKHIIVATTSPRTAAMSEEEARREAAILAYEAEGNMKVQANMRRMQEQGVIKVARPSRVVVPASTA